MYAKRSVQRALVAGALVVASALLGLSAAPAGAAPVVGPAGPAFYTPPSPLPPGVPGDVIWYRKSTFSSDPLFGAVDTTVNAWQVLYRSTNANGAATAVSGTVLVPKTFVFGARPIVAYAVGTQGLGDKCAPSGNLVSGKLYEASLIKSTLDKGWAVVVTDYEGLGTPGQHTYMVGRSSGRAVLDALRAAQRLPGSGLSTTAPVGIWGYSQGGQAAAAAAELHPTYAPTLNLKGVAAGGVPADLTRVAQVLEGSLFFGFLAAAAVGLDTAYADLKLTSYLNDTGKTLLAEHKDDCLLDALGPFAFKKISDLTTTNPLATPAWKARLAQQKLGGTAPKVPVYQYHATFDEIIPLDQAQALRTAYCAKGVKVTWVDVFLAEHLLGIFGGQAGAQTFLTDRFANKPVTSNC